ncbi:MAG: pyridoxal phosphate-dependent aminotransferase [Armatimonadetes bacterium]|nr:pyridoxal phosphate-dependent aminotransferase [Armatimonadota bacterium]
MTTRARELQAQGINVIAFAAGEPDFNTPSPICEAAKKAIDDGHTKYGPSRGFPALRNAIVEKVARENKFQTDLNQIVVSCGAKHSLYNTFRVLLDPGDEVILLAPYWMTYKDQVLLSGGVPVTVHTDSSNNFSLDVNAVKAAITPKTKAIVVNSPCNPTGTAFTRQEIKELAALAIKHNLWIVSDEIYEHLTYNHEHTSVATLGKEVAERTITILGCSKSYAMTGWRIGFSIAPPEITSAMANFQDQVTSNATSIAQYAAVAALNLNPEIIEGMRSEFEARKDLGLEIIHSIPGVKAADPKGAFYFFIDIREHLGGDCPDDLALAEKLLDQAHIATVPGSVFEADGFLRLSYACSRAELTEGLNRLKGALTS